MFEIFKRKKKLIVVHYVNVMGYTKERAKEKVEEYAASYAQFKDDSTVKEVFIPTTSENRLEFVKL